MATDWLEVTVEDIKSPTPNALATGPFGSSISARFFRKQGVPVIRGSNLTDDVGSRLIDDGWVFVSAEKAREFARSTVQRGDLIFTCWGTIGQVGLIDSRCPYNEYVISNKQMKLTPDPTEADSLFLYYLFSGPEMSGRIKAQAIGSSVPGFNMGQLRSLRLRLPPLPEQRAIASILGVLDDKIELNRRMNETLEAIARALFQSWFVNFDPVRAKMEGRQPVGMDAETAALFPSSLEPSTIGGLPMGWIVTSLSNLFPGSKDCVLTGPFGTNLHASDYRPDGVPLILVKHVNDGRISEEDLPLVGEHKVQKLSRYRLNVGDIVFTRVCAVGRSAYVHPRQAGWLISGQTLRVRVPNKTVLNPRYLAQLYLEPGFLEMVESYALGSTRPSLNTSLLQSFQFLVPPIELQHRFASIVASCDAQVLNHIAQSNVLATIRDTLLPKLLSGEIRVREAERELETVL